MIGGIIAAVVEIECVAWSCRSSAAFTSRVGIGIGRHVDSDADEAGLLLLLRWFGSFWFCVWLVRRRRHNKRSKRMAGNNHMNSSACRQWERSE